MKRIGFGIVLILMSAALLSAENFTLYAGNANKTQFLGLAISGDVGDFLQFHFDLLKYVKKDQNLISDNPKLDRSDLLGASGTFVLKLPIHLLPYLDRLDYIQPYLSAGTGLAIESTSAEYNDAPGAVDGGTGVFRKVRTFFSFGYGVIVMIATEFGIKLDFRTIDMAAHSGMGLPARKFDRVSVGVCFGPYKSPIKRIKK